MANSSPARKSNFYRKIRNSIVYSKPVRSLRRLWRSGETLRDLPFIMEQGKSAKTLAAKVLWAEHLMQWIRTESELPHGFDTESGRLHSVRLRFLFQILERNPDWKAAAADNLRSICRQTSAVQLFTETGLAQEAGFFSEGADRLVKRILPMPTKEHELSELFAKLFHDDNDAAWLRGLSDETFNEILELVHHGASDTEALFENWRDDILDALLILGANVASQGVHPAMRRRLPKLSVRESPFLELSQKIQDLVHEISKKGFAETEPSIQQLQFSETISLCRSRLQEVLSHLEISGVSVNLVYRLEMIGYGISRIEVLLKILSPREDSHKLLLQFISDLIADRLSQSTISQLVHNNLHLLSRKVVERAGASGEHYITRSRAEYLQMLWSAGGGGLITVATTVIKFAGTNFGLPFFFEGLFVSMNYAGSFLMMQFMGFTLATKQPSMTASALAGKMKSLKDPREADAFITEVVRITRSQFAAAVGNVGIVIPGAAVFEVLTHLMFGRSVVGVRTAEYVIQSLHPLHSLTVFYAALTGVILWASSLCAGWVENWVVYRQIPEALAQNRRLISTFGEGRTKDFSNWVLHNTSGFGGNVSIGFLLGFTPIFGRFFGLPLDIRHVTLSAGAFTFAASSLIRAQAVDWWALGAAAFGILLIGIMNFGVSFFLALAVAARARNVDSRWMWILILSGLKKLRESPREFFLPPKD